MYCSNCGAEIVGMGRFCTNCGAMVTDKTAVQQRTEQVVMDYRKTAKHQMKIRRMVVLAVAVLAVALIIAERSSYQRVVYQYFRACETRDAELLYSLYPEYYLEYCNQYAYEQVEGDLSSICLQWYRSGKIDDVEYKISTVKRATNREVEEVEEFLYEKYADEVMTRGEFDITDAYLLNITYTVFCEEDNQEYDTEILLIKENGKWRIMGGYIDTSFYIGNSKLT